MRRGAGRVRRAFAARRRRPRRGARPRPTGVGTAHSQIRPRGRPRLATRSQSTPARRPRGRPNAESEYQARPTQTDSRVAGRENDELAAGEVEAGELGRRYEAAPIASIGPGEGEAAEGRWCPGVHSPAAFSAPIPGPAVRRQVDVAPAGDRLE